MPSFKYFYREKKRKSAAIMLTSSVLLFMYLPNAQAKNAWYYGDIVALQTLSPDGSFIAYLNNQTILEHCAYKRVQFRASDMGIDRTKAALSMALTAFTAGKKWGVVVDMAIESGEVCYASPTASQGAGIQ